MIDKRPKTPREVAAFSLFSMAEEGAWSDGALHHYLSRAGLDGRDAALAARLTYGTVQNELLLDWYLRRFSSLRLKKIAPRVLACLRMGLYQLILMDKIPAHAAVAETVSLVRLLSEQFGQKLTERICQADNADTPVSVRVNRMKTTPDEAKAELERAGMTVTPHRAFADILLCTGGDAAATEAFREGRITVQDAASALAAFVADPKPGTAVLDCCAAPGGKSFAMAEKMQGKGSLTSCDIYEHKLKRIQEGAARLGLPNIRTELQDASAFRAEWAESADTVLCDVPCSGLGIIRKKPETRYKDPDEIAKLPALQLAILENCARYVKPGGTLVYSTCTILQRENEDVVRAFLAAHPEFAPAPWSHPVCGGREDGMVTLLPPEHDTDGFFIAKLKRIGN